MAGLNPNISIITLNVNNLYIPSKKEVGRVYKKKYPPTCCLKETFKYDIRR